MSETDDPRNVTNIGKARNKKKTENRRDDQRKLREVDIQVALSDAIRRLPEWMYGRFPVRYEVIEPAPGARLALRVDDDDVVLVVRKAALRQDVVTFVQYPAISLVGPEFLRTHKSGQAVVDLWMDSATPVPIETIKMTRWKSEPGMTYRRLPWDQGNGDCPTWDATLGRLSNRQAFVDWIGSLLVDDSNMHSYVWLYGSGGDGKGAINRFLDRVFGQAYRSKQPPNSHKGSVDKFWTFGLLGARLVVFPDCDNQSFTTSGFFKSLTGGDPVDVEQKGESSFTARLNAKFLIISNEKPTISSEKSDLRRIIYCEMTPPPGDDPGFEDRLWDEGGVFLTKCLSSYLEKYADRRAICPDPEAVADLVSENEQHFSDFFEKYFALDPKGTVLPSCLREAAIIEFGRERRIYSAFLRWLERRYGIVQKLGHHDAHHQGKRVKVLRGMAVIRTTQEYPPKPKNEYWGSEPDLNS